MAKVKNREDVRVRVVIAENAKKSYIKIAEKADSMWKNHFLFLIKDKNGAKVGRISGKMGSCPSGCSCRVISEFYAYAVPITGKSEYGERVKHLNTLVATAGSAFGGNYSLRDAAIIESLEKLEKVVDSCAENFGESVLWGSRPDWRWCQGQGAENIVAHFAACLGFQAERVL